MADLAKLVVRLEAQSSQLTKELQKTRSQLASFDKAANKAAQNIGRNIGLAASAAAAGFAFMVKNSIDAADELSKLSQKVGIATDELSKLNFAADLAGVETKKLQTGLQRLSQSAVDTAQGIGESKDAFAALGVSVTNTDGSLKGTSELIGELADAFAKFENGPTKTAAALDIFGRAGAELIPLLNQGSAAIKDAGEELDKFGGVVTPEAGRQAELFNDNLNRIETAAKGLANQVQIQLVPSMNVLTSKFIDAIKEGDNFETTSNAIVESAQDMAIAVAVAAESIFGIFKALRAVAGSFEVVAADLQYAFIRLNLGPAAAFFEKDRQQLDAALQRRNETVREANARYVDLWNYNATAVSDALRRSFDDQKKFANQSSDVLGQLGFSLNQGLEGGIPLRPFEIPFRPGSGAAAPDPKPTLDYSSAVNDVADATRSAAKATSQWDAVLELHQAAADEEKERQGAMNDLIAEAAQVIDDTRTPMDNYIARIERLNVLRDTFVNGKPLLDPVQYYRAVAQAQDALDSLETKTEDVTDNMSVYAEQAARNMQDAFADFLFDPFDKGLEGMLISFERTLRQMVANQAAENIFEAFSGGDGLLGGLGAVFNGVAGIFGGGMSSSGTVGGNIPLGDFLPISGGRAAGGPVMAGKNYLVGENGPELFTAGTSGAITPNNELGGNTYNVNVNVQAPRGSVARETLDQIAAATARGVQRASSRNN